MFVVKISTNVLTERGGRIGRALVSGPGDRGFEPMVESNQ